MTITIRAATEKPLFSVDMDSPEGREGIKEAAGAYALDYTTWLPKMAETYILSPRIEDYAIVCAPICPADLPNRNGIGFPLAELTKFRPAPMNRIVYKAWTGCPIHLEHDNEDYTKAHGCVLDTSLSPVSRYGDGKIFKVMGLYAIEKLKYPEIAMEVISGKIDTYSMGALADSFRCSYCDTPITQFTHCHHIDPRAGVDFTPVTDWNGQKHIAFRNAYDLTPFELSIVRDPAWTTAQSGYVLESIQGPGQFAEQPQRTRIRQSTDRSWY